VKRDAQLLKLEGRVQKIQAQSYGAKKKLLASKTEVKQLQKKLKDAPSQQSKRKREAQARELSSLRL
jgi:type III secretory pathway component EscU